ncbi:hypothetical protein [Streptomyces sp. NPDC001139]
MLLDGTVAETDRVQAEGHYSGKVRREGVNLQVITHARLREFEDAVHASGAGFTVLRPAVAALRQPERRLLARSRVQHCVPAPLPTSEFA